MIAALVACSDPSATDGSDSGSVGGDDVSSSGALVMPTGSGLEVRALDGTLTWSRTWTDLVGDCADCGGEGVNPDDGDGLLVAFTTGGGMGPGGVAHLGAERALDLRLDGYDFPHAVVSVASALVVAETSADRLVWTDPATGLDTAELGASTDADFDAHLPNGLHRFDWDGRTYLLVSAHGDGGGGPGGPPGGGDAATGALMLWDVTDADPQRVWRFPEVGSLATPHDPILRETDDGWRLLWAHTYGSEAGTGCVGVASLADPLATPRYLADLVPTDGPAVFLRGVELSSDGALILTDSGGMGLGTGRLLSAPLPSLAPTGATGAAGEDQVFVDLDVTELASGLDDPFEAWLDPR